MEEIEVPTEQVQEEIHHRAHGSSEKWVLGVALSSAIIAAFAAVAALMAGHHSNEAMIEQIQASDQWSYYQAKGVKSAVLQTKTQILSGMGRRVDPKDEAKIEEYKSQQNEIQEKATEKENTSKEHMRRHMSFARGVTLFQVAIAISAISVLTHRRRFWYLSLGFGLLGIVFFALGLS